MGHSSFRSGVGPPLWLLQTSLSFSSPQGSLCSARAQEGAPEGGARREDKQGTRENPRMGELFPDLNLKLTRWSIWFLVSLAYLLLVCP